ncbi:hypothetical protein [Streptomyces sp. NPDC048442]
MVLVVVLGAVLAGMGLPIGVLEFFGDILWLACQCSTALRVTRPLPGEGI